MREGGWDEWAPRKLSFEAARQEQRVYWAGKTMAERLAGMTALKNGCYACGGIDTDALQADWSISRVRRSDGRVTVIRDGRLDKISK